MMRGSVERVGTTTETSTPRQTSGQSWLVLTYQNRDLLDYLSVTFKASSCRCNGTLIAFIGVFRILKDGVVKHHSHDQKHTSA